MFAFIAAALISGQQYEVGQTPSQLLLQKKFILKLIIRNSTYRGSTSICALYYPTVTHNVFLMHTHTHTHNHCSARSNFEVLPMDTPCD